MRAVAEGEIIVALIENICACTIRIVSAEFGLIYGDGYIFHPAICGNFNLGVAHKFHGSLFNAVRPVVFSVGRLHIYCNYIFAGHIRIVIHRHSEREGVLVFRHFKI